MTTTTAATGWMTTEEAAAYLGLPSAAAVRMAVHRGTLRPSGRVGRQLRFTREDLDVQITSRACGRAAPLPAPTTAIEAPAPTPTTTVDVLPPTAPAPKQAKPRRAARPSSPRVRVAAQAQRTGKDCWGLRAALDPPRDDDDFARVRKRLTRSLGLPLGSSVPVSSACAQPLVVDGGAA
jgi:excisionase family DNA binding protein